ncbi:hypothetical protein L6452_31987 [Arctium lappa]|uniref:Uncharacterized protein n=1 Tax=Arctium lappa TaxID=4217 RepID=A0ACB8Z492_ARCLA|nr:hypothetical protein L6452_31987 [Arctium lappa]
MLNLELTSSPASSSSPIPSWCLQDDPFCSVRRVSPTFGQKEEKINSATFIPPTATTNHQTTISSNTNQNLYGIKVRNHHLTHPILVNLKPRSETTTAQRVVKKGEHSPKDCWWIDTEAKAEVIKSEKSVAEKNGEIDG